MSPHPTPTLWYLAVVSLINFFLCGHICLFLHWCKSFLRPSWLDLIICESNLGKWTKILEKTGELFAWGCILNKASSFWFCPQSAFILTKSTTNNLLCTFYFSSGMRHECHFQKPLWNILPMQLLDWMEVKHWPATHFLSLSLSLSVYVCVGFFDRHWSLNFYPCV